MMGFLYRLKEDIKAFFRNEKRVHPDAVGRVYVKKPSAARAASAQVEGSLKKVRVYRKATDTWETVYTKE